MFYEILSDYQFVELEDPEFYGGNAHVIGVTPAATATDIFVP